MEFFFNFLFFRFILFFFFNVYKMIEILYTAYVFLKRSLILKSQHFDEQNSLHLSLHLIFIIHFRPWEYLEPIKKNLISSLKTDYSNDFSSKPFLLSYFITNLRYNRSILSPKVKIRKLFTINKKKKTQNREQKEKSILFVSSRWKGKLFKMEAL